MNYTIDVILMLIFIFYLLYFVLFNILFQIRETTWKTLFYDSKIKKPSKLKEIKKKFREKIARISKNNNDTHAVTHNKRLHELPFYPIDMPDYEIGSHNMMGIPNIMSGRIVGLPTKILDERSTDYYIRDPVYNRMDHAKFLLQNTPNKRFNIGGGLYASFI